MVQELICAVNSLMSVSQFPTCLLFKFFVGLLWDRSSLGPTVQQSQNILPPNASIAASKQSDLSTEIKSQPKRGWGYGTLKTKNLVIP